MNKFECTDTKAAKTIKKISLSKILSHLKNGGSVDICTHTKAWRIKQKNIDQWNAVGISLLKENKGSLYMAYGKRYCCIDFCHIILN